jgi:hypothetical protein
MRQPERKCSICRALIDEEDLFCANCGAEAPGVEGEGAHLETQVATHNFVCTGCGASMSYDASAQALRCPFCGSEQLEQKGDTKAIAPSLVVPFQVDRDRADAILRKWLGDGWLRPGDLSQAAVVTKMTPVYVPYWVFSARTHTFWTGDTSQTPGGARGDWFPLAGEHQGSHSGVIIGASSALTPAETHALCPFDLQAGVEPEEIDLENSIYETFSVSRKYARPLAQQAVEALERASCDGNYIPGKSRNVHANVLLDGLTGQPMLLPVWITAYQYKHQTFRFLINGQTGESHGTKPISYRKIFGIVAVVLAVILAILLCMGAFGAIGAAMSDASNRSFCENFHHAADDADLRRFSANSLGKWRLPRGS